MTAPVPFSYAQAAKGLSTAPTKQSSSAPSPSKDAAAAAPATTSPATPIPSADRWAEDAEREDPRGAKPTNGSIDAASKTPDAQDAASSVPSLPESASVTAKDDDAASVQNAPSESASTWENKSQASTTVEKASEASGKRSEKSKGKKKAEKTATPSVPLTEAPVPAVNAWTARIQERKAKDAQKVTVPKQTAATNGTAQAASEPVKKVEENAAEATKEVKSQDEKSSASRKETKPDADSDKARKGVRSKLPEKDHKNAAPAIPLPPARDQESWPTPETAVDEQKKKSQAKGDRAEVERKEANDRPRGKQEWKSMDIIPNVIFSTPLPGSSSSRKGGRAGGRGGMAGSGKHSGLGSEKEAAASASASGESTKPSRSEPTGTLEGSAPAVGSTATDEPKSSGMTNDQPTKANGEAEVEGAQKNGTGSAPHITGQSHTYPRHHPQGRGNKPRRGEYNGAHNERRKDGDKETSGPNGRRVSTAVQADSTDDAEKRNASHEGQNGHLSKGSHERRQFTSFSGRERGGRGGRGGRGAFQSNHGQHTNGHSPSVQGSSTFSVRSPTAFNPEQAFYPATAPHGRTFRNGHRSQSVTTESMYTRPNGYHAQIPMQTFVPDVYEYHHQANAVPFVDSTQIIPMLLHQMDYYFSVENLCKDLFLRKHMDTKGFVPLVLIANFHRVKTLTTDIEVIKMACHQSSTIELRVGHDGRERLRRREGWGQWVLAMSERDPSAQNDGPEELQSAPMPQANGFEQGGPPYAAFPPASSSGSLQHTYVTGVHPGHVQDSSSAIPEEITNGLGTNGVNGFAGSNGHLETSTRAVSGEPDSFSDAQVDSLCVIVRKQEQLQVQPLPPAATRACSNASIDSKSVESGGNVKANDGYEGKSQGGPDEPLNPFANNFQPTTNPVRLYWVRGQDTPVQCLPVETTHEPYPHLRFKALEQRNHAAHGTCPPDMDCLYQFWSHFLVHKFNHKMYEEFRHFAFEDSVHRDSAVGLSNLRNYYGEASLSNRMPIREDVAHHYVDLVRSERDDQRPAFLQLRATMQNSDLHPRTRQLLADLMDPELSASLRA